MRIYSWHRTGLRCSAARQNIELSVVMTMCLWHGGVCEPSIRCLMAPATKCPLRPRMATCPAWWSGTVKSYSPLA